MKPGRFTHLYRPVLQRHAARAEGGPVSLTRSASALERLE